MVPADSTGISPVPAYSGYPTRHARFPYGTLTPCGIPSQEFPVTLVSIVRVLQPRTCRDMNGLGSSGFARHYSRNHCYFLFLRVLRCFSSPGSPSLRNSRHASGGLPHSDIRGSHRMCRSPRLIAACRVLHRLREPRHSPCALVHLDSQRALLHARRVCSGRRPTKPLRTPPGDTRILCSTCQ